MQENSVFDDGQIRWTFWLIRGLQGLCSLAILFCLWRYPASLNPYFSGTLLFTGILATIFIFALASVEKGLNYKKHYAWMGAQGLGVLGLCTPIFPVAILSLRETFNPKTKQAFQQTKTIYSYQPLSGVTKLSLVVLAILCLSGVGLFTAFQKNSAFLDVAFKEVNYSLPPNSSVKELYGIAGDCNAYGKSKCAVAAFLQILKQSPGDTKALANLAMAQSHYGHHALAVANFQRVLKKGYKSYDIYFFYGKSLEKTRMSGPALRAYQQAVKMNPELVDAVASVTLLLVEQGRHREALSFLQTYLEKHPDARLRFKAVQDNLKTKIRDI